MQNCGNARISHKTRLLLQETMQAVVTDGTGKYLYPFTKKGFKIFTKTGTGQTSNVNKRNLGGTHLEHAWSAVYFQYKNDRPLVLVVLVEHVGSSYMARACIRSFLRGLLQIKEHSQAIDYTHGNPTQAL